MGKEALRKAVEAEARLMQADEERRQRSQLRFEVESQVYKFQSHCTDAKYEAALSGEEMERVKAICTNTHHWLEDNAAASLDELKKTQSELTSRVAEAAPRLTQTLAAEEEERRKKAEEAAKWVPHTDGSTAAKREPRTKAEKMQAAEKKKEAGNKLFKQGDTADASLKYSQALACLDGLFDLSPDETKAANELRVTLHLNCALCYLKLGQSPQRVIENCNKALEISKGNPKGLFRRAQAYTALKEYEKAEADLNAALVAEPANSAVKKELANIAQLREKERARQRRMAQAMFGGLSEEAPAPPPSSS
jgi:tetratricopeptide (TPR) repeat protein